MSYLGPISSNNLQIVNYITNGKAIDSTEGWTRYRETFNVTFQATGSTVTLNNHGLSSGDEISFIVITTTTGISLNTRYYVVNPTANTFQVSATKGGSALTLTNNGSGTYVVYYPITGSGGSANVLWFRSTTSPLRGPSDFNFDKSTTNNMGEGVAYDFTVDNADLAKVLTITFDYEVVSGTYADGDLDIFIIQDPGGSNTRIQPAGYIVQSGSIGAKLKAIASFQTDSSVRNYRLCLHVASVSTSAYTLAIDNVVVGPQTVQYGAPVTDWQSYTPTGTWTTNTTYTGRWRRVGDSMQLTATAALSGAPNAVGLKFNMPAGYTIDTAKLANSNISGGSRQILGNVSILDSGLSVRSGVIVYESATSLWPYSADSTGDFSISNTMPITFGSGDAVSITATVPILGWSSTVQMSNDTDTRVVAASVSSGAGVNANNTAVQVPFGSTLLDTHGKIGTNQYTIPVPGLYRVVAQTRTSFPSANVTFNHTLSVFKNGVSAAGEAFQGDGGNASGLYWMYGSVNQIIKCVAGDILTVVFGTNYNTGNSNTSLTMFSVERLSGPSAIAASETVAARYFTSAGPTINNTTPIITYGTKVFDTHGSMSGNTYTIPVSGKYWFHMHVYTASTAYTAASFIEGLINKNGSLHSFLFSKRVDAAVTAPQGGNGSCIVDCLAGDTIQFRVGSGVSTTLNTTFTDSANYVDIYRVGN
jgi:hypothetical protein